MSRPSVDELLSARLHPDEFHEGQYAQEWDDGVHDAFLESGEES